jgi:hypothetical protein
MLQKINSFTIELLDNILTHVEIYFFILISASSTQQICKIEIFITLGGGGGGKYFVLCKHSFCTYFIRA